MPKLKNTVNIFFTYVEEDKEWQERLDEHLAVLKSRGEITIWHKEMVLAGEGWEDAANKALYAADIILILVSAYFLASDRQYEVEMKNALERHKQGSTIVVPIILSDCMWNLTELNKLQVLPTNKIPITNLKYWGSIDAALANVAYGINKVVDGMIRRKDTGQIIPIVIPDAKQTWETRVLRYKNILLAGLFMLIMLVAAFGIKMWLDQLNEQAKSDTPSSNKSDATNVIDTSNANGINTTKKDTIPDTNKTEAGKSVAPEPTSGTKPASTPQTKSESTSGTKSEPTSGTKPKTKPKTKPVSASGTKSASTPETKSASTSGTKSESTPETKPKPPPEPVKNNNKEYNNNMVRGNEIIEQVRDAMPSEITAEQFKQAKGYYTAANKLKTNITIPLNTDEYVYCKDRGLRYAKINECENAKMWFELARLITNSPDIAAEIAKCQ